MENITKEYEKLLKKAIEMPGIADLMRLIEELEEERELLAQLQVEEYGEVITSNRSFYFKPNF
ncbi:MAG: hypothetical protein J7K23_01485 [Thermoproteales archaeon]|nr:hypothetical protein [Thermoproteales archaeon]